jgi:hypothetical protein
MNTSLQPNKFIGTSNHNFSSSQKYLFEAQGEILKIEEFVSDESAKAHATDLADRIVSTVDVHKLYYLATCYPELGGEKRLGELESYQISKFIEYFLHSRLPLLHAAYLLEFGSCKQYHKEIKTENIRSHLFWYESAEFPSQEDLEKLSNRRFELEDKTKFYRALTFIPANEAAVYLGLEGTQVKAMYVSKKDFI